MRIKTIKCVSLHRLLKPYFTQDDISEIYEYLSNTMIAWGADAQRTLIEPKTLFEVIEDFAQGLVTEETPKPKGAQAEVHEKLRKIRNVLWGRKLLIMIEDR